MKPPSDFPTFFLRIICVVCFFMVFSDVYSQDIREKVQDQVFNDTLGSKAFKKSDLASNAFYDTMLSSKSWFVRTLASLLIGGRSSADDAYAIKESTVSREYFATFSGKTITKINIVNTNIFSRTEDDDLSWIENTIDKLHIKTKYEVIAKNLLFKVGQKLNPYTMAINEQFLRNKSFLATAFFIILPDKNHPNGVTVNVFTRDNWTISVSGVWGGNPRGDIYDRNFLGSGNMLMLSYYPKTSNQYDAFEAKYFLDNIGGTFAEGVLKLGVGATNNSLMLDVKRPFILPSDLIWGFKMGYIEEPQGMRLMDSTMQVKWEEVGGYFGYTLNLNKSMGTTLYATIGPRYVNYTKGLDATLTHHPYYADRFTFLGNLGISQQNFFQGNLIYGYGRTEDIPYGYQFEATFGWEYNFALGPRFYTGGLARWGGLTSAGYFDIGAGGGSYIRNNKIEQGQLWFQTKYFSPLIDINSYYLRQFANLSYSHGFHRLEGERELIGYDGQSFIHGLNVPRQSLGINRLTLQTETVFFSPIFFYHFRFAFFGWFDMGWLGRNNVFYKNDFSSAIGLGVRIKNERLIFDNIQFRIGFSLKRPSESSFSWFEVSNENTLRVEPFTPGATNYPQYN